MFIAPDFWTSGLPNEALQSPKSKSPAWHTSKSFTLCRLQSQLRRPGERAKPYQGDFSTDMVTIRCIMMHRVAKQVQISTEGLNISDTRLFTNHNRNYTCQKMTNTA
jgi:hypothetical protein